MSVRLSSSGSFSSFTSARSQSLDSDRSRGSAGSHGQSSFESPAPNRKGKTKSEELGIPLGEWLWQQAIFFDTAAGINPWGFENEHSEARFQEYFVLTFTTNNKRYLARFFCVMMVKNAYGLFDLASEMQTFSWRSFGYSSILYRFLIATALFGGFSRKVVAGWAIRIFRTVFLSTWSWMIGPFAISEACVHASLGNATTVKALVMIYGAFVCIRCGFWTLALGEALVMSLTTTVYYFFHLQQQQHPWKLSLTFDLLLWTLALSLAGATSNAYIQVARRRAFCKHMCVKKQPRTKKNTSGARPRAKQHRSLRDVTETNDETETEDTHSASSTLAHPRAHALAPSERVRLWLKQQQRDPPSA